MKSYSHYQNKLGKSPLIRAWHQYITPHLKKIDRGTWFKNIALAAVALCLLFAILFLGAYAWFSKDLPDPDTLLTRNVSLTTKIFDRTGTHLLYEIAGDEKRTLVTLDQIPLYLQQAVISAEDENFYTNHGISIKGILRAIIFHGNRGGGSTITQQLVKNAILTNEATFTRKFKEIIMSLALDRNFTKDQILQMYLNEIPYGGTNYGVETASQAYFNKHVTDLTLAEAATLAGLPQAPTRYLNYPDQLKERRDWILGRMAALGYISPAEADAAIASDSPVAADFSNGITAPHFVFWVKQLLEETYSAQEVDQGGLTVTTTLDYDKQMAAEKAVTEGVAALGERYSFNNAGLTAIDPKTGQILAMVGSVDYKNDDIDGQVNVTTRPLQPGSSIKPIVYAAAFEKGYTPNTILWDVDTNFTVPGGNYSPKNYHLDENGPVTIRKALQGSLNVPAVKLLYLVGVDRALDFAEKLGYSTFTDRSNFGLAIVLGGAEVKLLEHTNAYATFANNGLYHNIVGVLKVVDSKGTTLEEWQAEENVGTQAISSNIAATLSNVLSDNSARSYVFGTGSYLQLGGRPVAAKTGTTNDFNDAWTLGYTPSLATGVWVGNTNGKEMSRGADGSIVAAPIWNAFMRAALANSPVENFPAASIPTTGKPVLDGVMPSSTATIDTASGKLATELTPTRYLKEITCGEYHTILQYLDKNSPLAITTSALTSDPYYTPWETALQTWITKHNTSLKEGEVAYESCTIPTENDDVHTKHNEPNIKITSPINNDSVGRTLSIQYQIEVKRSFNRLEFQVDNSYLGTSYNTDSAALSLPSWVTIGEHTITATIFDDVDNQNSDEVTINVTEPGSSLHGPVITNPFPNQTIIKTSGTYTISIETPDAPSVTSLHVTQTNLWNGSVSTIGELISPSSIASLAWTLPSGAEYSLVAVAIYQDGTTAESPAITVLVEEPQTVPAPPIISLLPPAEPLVIAP
jgi:1A family penicillin-binding protein